MGEQTDRVLDMAEVSFRNASLVAGLADLAAQGKIGVGLLIIPGCRKLAIVRTELINGVVDVSYHRDLDDPCFCSYLEPGDEDLIESIHYFERKQNWLSIGQPEGQRPNRARNK